MRVLPLVLCLVAALPTFAADVIQGIRWVDQPAPGIERLPRAIHAHASRLVVIDAQSVGRVLADVPLENTPPAAEPTVIALPMPDGSAARFSIVRTHVLAPELGAQYPDIRSFIGQGIDDPHAAISLSLTVHGLHAFVRSPHGDVFIDPAFIGERTHHAVYYFRDYIMPAALECGVHAPMRAPIDAPASGDVEPARVGPTLRTYRLAVAATGEYTQVHGGTVAGALAAIAINIGRVNLIYETELAIRFQLIANNNLIIFTDPATDPFNDTSNTGVLNTVPGVINTRIGSANYDIGHAFSTSTGGVAFLGVVCRTNKAGGVSGSGLAPADPYSVMLVAHEIGHQFNANHTFNGLADLCGTNRSSAAAIEPGSGSTYMSYGGQCVNDNVVSASDLYPHSRTFDETTAYAALATGGSCSQNSSTGNLAPTVNAGPDRQIPANTPFELSATASDPNGDPLTFTWEQRDIGAAVALASGDNGTSAIIRSLPATTSPVRTIPNLQSLRTNTRIAGEILPTRNRTLNFRVTARDNRVAGGGVNTDDVRLTVTDTGRPFRVLSPNTAVILAGQQTVTWDPANTAAAPINTANVRIRLSTDGGLTYPLTLISSTPNDGSESVTLPDVWSSSARIRVDAVDNIFFDISDVDFALRPQATGIDLVAAGAVGVADAAANGNANGRADSGERGLSLTLPVQNLGLAGASGVSGALSSLTPTATVVRASAAYPAIAPRDAGSNSGPLVIDIAPSHPCGEPVLLRLTLSTDQGTQSIDFVLPVGLPAAISAPQQFDYTGPVVPIPDNNTVAEATLTAANVGSLADVDLQFLGSTCNATFPSTAVGLEHSAVGNLVITLVSPDNTEVVLAQNPGGVGQIGNNFCQTRFDDDGVWRLVNNITTRGEPWPYPVIPQGDLNDFNGRSGDGVWRLRIRDTIPGDTGNIRAFRLIVRSALPPVCAPPRSCPADRSGDGTLDINDFFAYLGQYAANEQAADFNGDGLVDISDFFSYLSAFAAGC